MNTRIARQGVLCLAALACAIGLGGSAQATTVQSGYADQVYTSINNERTSRGIAPLTRIQAAELEATLHAMDMANREYLDHYTAPSPTPVVPDPAGHPNIAFTGGMGPDGRLQTCGYNYTYYGWGENVAYNWGYGAQSPDIAVSGWMNSPGHRDNILNTSFQGTGVGCAQSASGAVYYCQVFVVYTAGQQTISNNAALWSGGTTSSTAPPPPASDTTAPAAWTSFAPSATASLSPVCRVRVTDSGSGLNVASARYQYFSAATGTWSGWLAASCTGTSGTTAQQEISTPAIPFNVQSNQNRVQFQITDQAGNVGTSSVYFVTTDTTAPGSWTNFAPTVTYSVTPTCTVQVSDSLSGLNVSRPYCRYSTNGGYTWSGWRTATCTGVNGTTAPQTITASGVPIYYAQPYNNLIQFAAQDLAGTWGYSPWYTVNTRGY